MRRGGTAVVAALCACAVAAAPGVAAAADDAAGLPGYRTADGAQAVHGAASSADGPRLTAGALYTDTLGPGQKKYYSVRLDAASNAWISATAAPEPGSAVAYGDGVEIVLESTDGTTCDRSQADFSDEDAARPVAALAGRLADPEGRCQEAGVYTVSVERESDAASDPAPWPVELSFRREPGLRGGPAAAATTPPEPDTLPTTPPSPPTGQGRRLQGGTGFNDAAGMSEGVWKDRLRPGGTRFYRVPVDWGQQLFVDVEFGTAPTAEDAPYVSGGVRVDVYDPVRGLLGTDATTYRGADPAAIPVAAPPVGYVNRYSSNRELARTAFAGWYYVAVHAHADLADVVRGTVPVTLRTTVAGKPQAGPPYDGDAVAAGFGVSEADREQAADGLTVQQARHSATLRVVGWSGIGAGTVLVAALGVWTAAARRRQAAVSAHTPTA